MVLGTVFVRNHLPIGKMFLESRIHQQLFTNGMPGELPSELVLPSVFLIVGGRGEDLVVCILELTMVVFDGLCDASHDWHRGGAE